MSNYDSADYYRNEYREIIHYNAEYNGLVEDTLIPVAADDPVVHMRMASFQESSFMGGSIQQGHARYLKKYVEEKYELLPETWPDVIAEYHAWALKRSTEESK